LIISLILWVAATLLWASVPLAPSWFATEPRTPNFEYYPQSDASLYDTTAQNALVGMGFMTKGSPAALRPMYALFLVIFHVIGGPGYEPIILMQVGLLALFPVIIYWLTKMLHNRLSAIIAAILIVLREANAIALTDEITISHSKLLMSDLPTAAGTALFILIITLWLRTPDKWKYLPLVAGGVAGLFMLIRVEFAVFLPFVGLVALAIFKRRPTYWFNSMLLIGTGMVLMVSPWIWRNWRTTGIIYFDSPHFRTDLIAERYTSTPEEPNTVKLPEETHKEYTDRMTDSAADFVRENPEEVSNFILNHFSNSEIQMVLMFPTTFRLIDSAIGYFGHHSGTQFWEECCSPSNYIRRLPFWHKWTGVLPNQSIVPILITLLLAAVGLSKSWDRNRVIGMVPLIISIAYLSVNALVRNSGGRYVLAVDWTGIIYYSIGLAHISIKGISYFQDRNRLQIVLSSIGEMDGPITIKGLPSVDNGLPLKKAHFAIAALIILIGCALPITEQAFPQRYTQASQAARLDDILANEDNLLDPGDIERLEFFIGNDGKVIEGRALYPRNFTAKRGETGQGWLEKKAQPAFHLQPYSRTIFYMVGPRNITIVLRGAKRIKLPNASDVLVIGCPRSGTIDAIAVIVYPLDGSDEFALVRTPLPTELSCPLEDPE
jgi:4-amino-4-deoxy-L-arabinose transferase-like glycosyltransferase